MADRAPAPARPGPALDIFLVSLGILLLELALIRWLPGNLRLLAFFSNFVLLACFLGMSVGLLVTGRVRAERASFPLLLALVALMSRLEPGIHIDRVGGTRLLGEGAAGDPSLRFLGVLVLTFLLVAAIFIGPGERLGRLFSQLPPLMAYSVNVGGSLAGILVIMGCSWLSLGPLPWFALAGLAFLWPMRAERGTLALSAVCLAASLVVVARVEQGAVWSPYNRIVTHVEQTEGVEVVHLFVNEIGHQSMLANWMARAKLYDVPFVVSRAGRGERPLGKVLVIGAGSGNDVSHALSFGAERVDAVEIDPQILELGRRLHPEQPYSDGRVRAVVTDGRAFLHDSPERYDWVVYALVDSLSLFSHFGSVRLENYLYTTQAMEEARRVLEPGGIFVAYNYYHEGWLVVRLYRQMQEVFGDDAVVCLTFPPRTRLDSGDRGVSLALFMAGDVAEIRKVLEESQVVMQIGEPLRLEPVREVSGPHPGLATDDWPFPYLREASIPRHNALALGAMLALAALMVALSGGLRRGGRLGHFFFLGCAFMMIETRGIARLALLFGSTWVSNSLTFAAILGLILVANLVAARRPNLPYSGLYAELAACLALDAATPFESLLSLGPVARAVLGSTVLFLPMLFAGIIFARSFSQSRTPQSDLGANVLGAMAGGCLEALSLILGYRWLVLVVMACYAASLAMLGRPRPSSS